MLLFHHAPFAQTNMQGFTLLAFFHFVVPVTTTIKIYLSTVHACVHVCMKIHVCVLVRRHVSVSGRVCVCCMCMCMCACTGDKKVKMS